MTWLNGNSFEGQWRFGKMDGYGKFLKENAYIYTGNFKFDKKHGYGRIS